MPSSQATSYLWSTFSSIAKTDAEPQRNAKSGRMPAQRTRKIKFHPNKRQRDILNQWFDTARWTYNQVVQEIREGAKLQKKQLRALCVNNDLWEHADPLIREHNNEWVKETPYDIRDEAMNDVLKAYKTNFALERDKFTIGFKSKKASSDSIVIHRKHWKKAGIMYPKKWGKKPIWSGEKLPDDIGYDTRIQRTRLGEFYLCLLTPMVRRSESQAPVDDCASTVVALDPGVRTFQTLYSPDGHSAEIGAGDMARITRLCWALDKLQSKWSQKDVRHKQRYNMQRAGRRIRKKIQNLVRDIHHKTAKYLCENYRHVLIPLFETKNMVSRIKRKIGSKTARAMLTWSHYRFRMILEEKAKEYPWCNVHVVNEAYTSKTCGCCGELHEKLGSSKVFRCPSCEVTLDRDVNGARNILLRYLTCNEEAVEIREKYKEFIEKEEVMIPPLRPSS